MAYVISLYLPATYETFKPQVPERRCAMSNMTEPPDTSVLLAHIKSRLQASMETAYAGLSCTDPKPGERRLQTVM